MCTQPPPPGYGRVGPDVNFPGVKWYDGRKALFTLDVVCDSTLHILDPSIHMFFKHLVAVQQLSGSFCTIARVSHFCATTQNENFQGFKTGISIT